MAASRHRLLIRPDPPRGYADQREIRRCENPTAKRAIGDNNQCDGNRMHGEVGRGCVIGMEKVEQRRRRSRHCKATNRGSEPRLQRARTAQHHEQ